MNFLAQANPLDEVVGSNSQGLSGAIYEVLVVLTATLGLGLVLLVGIYLMRRRNRRRSGQKIYRSPLRGNETSGRRRRRRKRKEMEVRNAPLAETGGLPPIKNPGPETGNSGTMQRAPES